MTKSLQTMDFFDQNRRLVAEHAPELMELFETLPPPPPAERSKTGGLTVKIAGVQLASRVDPQAEGEKFARAFSPSEGGKALIYGMGMGYHIEALLKSSSKVKKIFVIEANPEILSALFHYRNLEPVFKSGRFTLITGDSDSELSRKLSDKLSGDDDWSVSIHPPSYRSLPEKFKKLKSAFELLRSDRRFKGRFEEREKRNIRENLQAVASSAGVSMLFSKLEGRAAMIVGAGPSLDRNLYILEKLQDRVFVLATDTSAPVLIANGISFNAVVSVDPQPISALHFHHDSYLAPLIFFPTTHPWVVKRHSGKRLLVIREMHPIFKKAEKLLNDRGTCEAGGSVSCVGLDILIKSGADPIGFIGQDFAFPHGIAYNRWTLSDVPSNEPVMNSESSGTLARVGAFENLPVDFAYGRSGATHANLLGYLRTFEELISANPERKFMNINSAGANIQGCTNLFSLGEVCKSFCNTSQPPEPIRIAKETERPELAKELDALLFS